MASQDSEEVTIRLQDTSLSTLQFDRRPWQVPSESRALEGSLEGVPSKAARQDAIERARREREDWHPSVEAWQQLIQLQAFVGKRVRVQFFDPGTMYLLNEDEWPHPVQADCTGIVTLIEDGRLQAFMLLRSPKEGKTGGSSGVSYLRRRGAFAYSLAPVADLYEVTSLGDAE